MKKLLLRWTLLAFSVAVASMVSQALGLGFHTDVSSLASILELFIGVAILSLLNVTVGKVLKFITFPITCLTLGLFSLVINAVILMVAASLKLGFVIEEGSTLKGFLAAFVASILIAAVNGVLGVLIPDEKDHD